MVVGVRGVGERAVGSESDAAVGALGHRADDAAGVLEVVGTRPVTAGDRVETDRGVFVGDDGVGHDVRDRGDGDGQRIGVGQHAVGGGDREVETAGAGIEVGGRGVRERSQGRVDLCRRAGDRYRAAAVAGDRGAAAARDGQRAAARRQAQGGRETGVVDVGDREPGDHEGRVLERALGQGQGVDRQVIDRVDVDDDAAAAGELSAVALVAAAAVGSAAGNVGIPVIDCIGEGYRSGRVFAGVAVSQGTDHRIRGGGRGGDIEGDGERACRLGEGADGGSREDDLAASGEGQCSGAGEQIFGVCTA